MILESIFWTCIIIVFYSYIGYGIIVFFIVKINNFLTKKTYFDPSYEPEVTLIVPCFNEADFIENKIQNSLTLDYPNKKLKLIFISDGSSDNTHEIIKKYPSIIALHENERSGKAAAMNRSMLFVTTPIVVFCDANTMLNKEAIKELVKHYQNEKVGAVTGEKRIVSSTKEGASTAGEGIYWKYESLLKKLDSDFYSVVGAAGELMSYRTKLYKELPNDTLLDDLMQSMLIAIDGYKVIYEKKAFATETASANVKEELKRKIRISAGAWQSMFRLGKAFNPFHNFKLFFAFISHRVLRWTLAPLSLLVLLILNVLLASNVNIIYSLLLVFQSSFYAFAILGWYFENKRIKVKMFFVPYYFFIMNLCVYLGLFRFLKGKQSVSWERAQRA
jgi:cellulose synthase/poly-beta-1,6-N-acetylglucosamine synthase-like glycosyltransferase